MGLVAVAASSALILGACGGGNGTAGQQSQQSQQSQQGGAAPGGGNSNAVASSCAAANQILDNTQSYTGKQVTFTGTVAQVVGPHAFTVAATGNNNGGILGGGNNNGNGNGNNANNGNNSGNNAQGNGTQTLLAVDKDAMSLTPGSPVQVTGTLQPTFDTNQAQSFTGGNLDQATFTAYNGKPYVQAVSAGPVSANLTNSNQGSGILGGGNNGSCAAADQVLNNTQSYIGQQVTITGTVAQVVGPHAFTIAANGNNNNGGIVGGNNNGNNAQGSGTQTLLAVDKETTSLTPGSSVQVTGTLQPTFDTNQAQTFTGGNLDQAAFTAYNGKPYVQAVYAGPASANLSGSQNGR